MIKLYVFCSIEVLHQADLPNTSAWNVYNQFKLLQPFAPSGDIYFKQARSMLDSKSKLKYFYLDSRFNLYVEQICSYCTSNRYCLLRDKATSSKWK